MPREIRTAVTWATAATLALAGLIVAGSRNLSHFDAPLVAYTFASLFAAFGIAYRYAMWLQRVPIAYGPQYWSLVFPLGMYTVATFMLEKATGLSLLAPLPPLFVYPALLAWLLTFAGTLRALGGVLLGARESRG